MNKKTKIVFAIAVSFPAIILIAITVIYIQWLNLKTKPFLDMDGNIIQESVSETAWLKLGGMKQFVMIRGKDVSNPVLLFLHGGPGSPEMALVRKYCNTLEEHFIVVNWDQRGAGKSYSPFIPKNEMKIDGFLADARELTSYLKSRFGKRKIYIVGHSWGSILGVNLVQKYPDDYYAYVGIGQVVNMKENERVSFEHVFDIAKNIGDKNAIKELSALKETYPNTGKNGIHDLMTERKYLLKYGGVMYGQKDYSSLIKDFGIDEYNLYDIYLFLSGSYFSINAMWYDLLSEIDFSGDATFKVPVYIIMGSYDYNTPIPLAEKYFQKIHAPKKEFFEFEKSAHMIINEEPENFCRILIERVKKDTYH